MPAAEPILRVTLPRSRSSLPLRDLLGFASGLVAHAARKGGRGRCFCLPEAVVAEFVGLQSKEAEPFIEAIPCEPRLRLTVVLREVQTHSLPPGAPIQSGEYIRAKLTKTLLYALPPGAILLSNACDADGQPRFCALTRAPHDREKLWKSAKSVGVANRTVDVLWDLDDVGELLTPP